eukprot:g47574.t1
MVAPIPTIYKGEEEEVVPGDSSHGKVNVADFWTCFNNVCLSELRYWRWFYNFELSPDNWEKYVKGLGEGAGVATAEGMLKRVPRE